jgi:O-antigen ligase
MRIVQKLAEIIIIVQPLFGGLVFISMLAGWPPLWLSWLIFMAPSALSWRRYRQVFTRTPYDIGIAILVAGYLVGLAVTPNLPVSLNFLQTVAASIIIYHMVVINGLRFNRYWMPFALVAVLFFISVTVVTFAQVGAGARVLDFNAWLYRLTALFGLKVSYGLGVNLLGILMGILVSGATAFAVFHRLRRGRMTASIVAVIGAFILIMSASTSGLLAAVAGLLFCLLLWKPWTIFAALPAAAAVNYLLLSQPLNSSLGWLAPVRSFLGRTGIWERTWRLLDGHLLTGLGPGTWWEQHLVIAPAQAENTHNDFLQTVSDAGTLGGIAVLVFIAVTAVLIWRLRKVSGGDAWSAVGLSAAAATIAFAAADVFESHATAVYVRPGGAVDSSSYIALSIPLIWLLAAMLATASLRASRAQSCRIDTDDNHGQNQKDMGTA